MIFWLYRSLLSLAGPFLNALLRLRCLRGLEERDHLQEKMGIPSLPRPEGKLVWVHAASVGEMQSVIPLVQKILDADAHTTCLITTVTVTAARLTRRRNNPRILHQYAPLDNPRWVNRFIDYWKPDAVLWVESEIWPVTLQSINKRRLPLAMVNGRLSARSAARWAKLPGTIGAILSWFDVALAQSADDAARLTALGADAREAGNIKYAAPALPADPEILRTLQSQIAGRPSLLFASTHAGEEEIAAQTYKGLAVMHPDILVVIMPRHPTRGDEIAALLRGHGLTVAQRSKGDAITSATQIYLGDTLGEAGLFYRLSPVVFVGNSLILVPGGGHNLLEPAHLDCAVLHGPHMWNFPEIERDLRNAGGSITVADTADLIKTAARLLNNAGERQILSFNAHEFVKAQDSVLDTVIGYLRPVLARAGIAL